MTTRRSAAPAHVIPGTCFGTFTLPAVVVFVTTRGKGANLWTTDGRQLIDFVLGAGPMLIGHAHPRVEDCARKLSVPL
jgi:glutamate-1-semialdehyde 2,1-aminomutase